MRYRNQNEQVLKSGQRIKFCKSFLSQCNVSLIYSCLQSLVLSNI